MSTIINLPTQKFSLPSKGLLYPETSPLSSGEVELRIPNSKDEDILNDNELIIKGTAIDKFLHAVIISPINFDDLLIGDYNAIMIAARILAYGSFYPVTIYGEKTEIELSALKETPVNFELYTKGLNELHYNLPLSKYDVTFKILTHRDELNIQSEMVGMKNVAKSFSTEVTTRLKHMITSVNGNREQKYIREFANQIPSIDSKALRSYIASVTPDIDMTCDIELKTGQKVERVPIPITIGFFWDK